MIVTAIFAYPMIAFSSSKISQEVPLYRASVDSDLRFRVR